MQPMGSVNSGVEGPWLDGVRLSQSASFVFRLDIKAASQVRPLPRTVHLSLLQASSCNAFDSGASNNDYPSFPSTSEYCRHRSQILSPDKPTLHTETVEAHIHSQLIVSISQDVRYVEL